MLSHSHSHICSHQSVTMRAVGLILTAIILTSTVYSRMVSEEESRKIIKRELLGMAYNFQSHLRNELSSLESEMYTDFLSFMEEISLSQTSFTEAIRNNLSINTADTLEKFGKVMIYSAHKVDLLNKQLLSAFSSLGVRADDALEDLMRKFEEAIPPSLLKIADNGRSRRRSLISDPENALPLLQDLTYEDIFEAGDSKDDLNEEKSHHLLLGELGLLAPEEASEETTEELPRDCLDLLERGQTEDGVYTIYLSGVGVSVWCDQSGEDGGWTVVVSRRHHHQQLNFSRPVQDYVEGFGDPHTQHWIGLDQMSALTRSLNNTLRVDVTHQHSTQRIITTTTALYHNFSVGDGGSGYELRVGDYDPSSSAVDALTLHSNTTFSFPGRNTGVCAKEVGVGWWFLGPPNCYHSLPTGRLRYTGRGGMSWSRRGDDAAQIQSLVFMIRRQLT